MLEDHWQERDLVARCLRPVAAVYCGLTGLRRWAYERRLLDSGRLPVPVIVVGNITVGGTGKTPLVIWLFEFLRRAGYRPGIVSRGYKGRSPRWPREVDGDSDPAEVGDEPVMLARKTGGPVVAGPDRAAAARQLLASHDCDVVLSDDGLQHYGLARDIEIAVIDGQRRFGNGFCLPAGPLREKPDRLSSVDLCVVNGDKAKGCYQMTILPGDPRQVIDPGKVRPLREFSGRPVHAVAGTGYPARFFAALSGQGIQITEHPFPDHHSFVPADLEPAGNEPVLMTEKDAVKCTKFAGANCWFVPAVVQMEERFGADLLVRLENVSL